MSLSLRTGLLVAMVALSVGLVTALVGGVLAERLINKELLTRAHYIARSFTETKLQWVIDREVIPVRDAMLRVVARTDDVEYLYILDFDGRLFTHSFQGGFPSDLLRLHEDRATSGNITAVASFESKQGHIIEVNHPLITGMAARLHVGINQRLTTARISKIRRTLFGFSLLVTVFGVLVGIYFSRRVTQPLGKLAVCMRDYGQGRSVDLGTHVFATTTETRELAESFTQMIEERKKSDQALKESRAMLRLVLDSIPVRVFWKDRESRYLGCNARFAEDAGLQSVDEIVGKDDYQLTWRAQAERYQSDDREVVASGKAKFDIEESQTLSDGGQRWLETSKIPLREESGAVAGVLGVYQDITQRKNAETALSHSRAQFEAIFNSISDAAVFADTERRIVAINPAVTKLFGYTNDELLGQTTETLYASPQGYREQGKRRFNLESKSATAVYEQRYKRRDGSVFAGETLGGKVVDAHEVVLGFIGVIRDVTERKQTEQQLSQYREQLESLVESRTKELSTLNNELESFNYSVSHDLRTPLRSIDGFSHALLEEYGSRLDETGRNYLERIRRATHRMGELIDDLLDLSKVTRRTMRLEEVNLSDIARQICEQLHEAEPHRKVGCRIEADLKATCDAGLVRIVLQNLLENAWKYSAKVSSAHIEFGAGEATEEGNVFYVSDNGVGFDMQFADRLFGAFQRLHRTGEFEGTGVGLATVQRIVHRHGGRIWAQAEVGKGARFFFTLGSPDDSSLREDPLENGAKVSAWPPRAMH